MKKRRCLPLVAVMALTACAPTVSLDAAEDAPNPVCAAVSVRLPEAINPGLGDPSLASRQTDAQATGAWGDPAAVTLRCGVPIPAPTPDPCYVVDGIEWVAVNAGEESDAYTFVTYGRAPAVEVVVDPNRIAGQTALAALADAVSFTEPFGDGCVDPDEVQ